MSLCIITRYCAQKVDVCWYYETVIFRHTTGHGVGGGGGVQCRGHNFSFWYFDSLGLCYSEDEVSHESYRVPDLEVTGLDLPLWSCQFLALGEGREMLFYSFSPLPSVN